MMAESCPSCSLFLTDPSVSRKHAQIDPTPDGPLIKDLDSGNGTFVNGEQIFQAVTLKDRDRIRFGESEFTFMEKPAE